MEDEPTTQTEKSAIFVNLVSPCSGNELEGLGTP